MAPDCEVLFLHVPKFSNYYKPLDEFMNITYAPMGVFALADLLEREGRRVRILHAGLEWILDHGFSIIEYIGAHGGIKIVFMPLFWHYQSYDVVSVARKIKARFPHIRVYLGGFTASYFAEQLVGEFDFIDGVVKGCAEEPVKVLCEKILDRPAQPGDIDFSDVPNLVLPERLKRVRAGGDSAAKTSCYVTSQQSFDGLRFANLALLENFVHYVKWFSFPLAYSKNLSPAENLKLNNMGLTMFPVEVGRGCSTSCAWCAGSAPNQRRMNHGPLVLWRSPGKVADTISEALAFGYKTFAVCFDPEPAKQQYYLELFEIIRRRKIKCGLYFECYALPGAGFIESFKKTFELERSVVAISPECGDEAVRRGNKGFYFSNEEFFKTLGALESNGLKTDVFFTMGVPHENIKTLFKTKELISRIHRDYRNIGRMMTWGIQTEPGSPMFENPSDHSIITDRKSFSDFYRIHSGLHADTYSALGYSVADYFLDKKTYSPAEFSEKIMRIKCRHFCFLRNDCASHNMPFAGRLTCGLRAVKFKLRGFGAARYYGSKRAEFS